MHLMNYTVFHNEHTNRADLNVMCNIDHELLLGCDLDFDSIYLKCVVLCNIVQLLFNTN